jgi:hypothetical protein
MRTNKCLKKITVTVDVWDCGEGHHHQSEKIALACIKKYERKEKDHTVLNRNIGLFIRHAEGERKSDLARSIDRTPTIVNKAIAHIIYDISMKKKLRKYWRVLNLQENKEVWINEVYEYQARKINGYMGKTMAEKIIKTLENLK